MKLCSILELKTVVASSLLTINQKLNFSMIVLSKTHVLLVLNQVGCCYLIYSVHHRSLSLWYKLYRYTTSSSSRV